MIAENVREDVASPAVEEKRLIGAVLVCGGGIAGIQASLDLSAAGFFVYLVEESPTIGGNMARLDKTFPTGDCATCIISPKVVACMRDLNIEVLTMAEVVKLEGEAGNFKATVRTKPRSVNPDKCTGCGDCIERCPVRNVPQPVLRSQPRQRLGDKDNAFLDDLIGRHKGDPGALMPVLEADKQDLRPSAAAASRTCGGAAGYPTCRRFKGRKLLRQNAV